MRTLLFYSSLTAFIFLFFLNCDSTTDPQSLTRNTPLIESISVSPVSTQFSLAQDGYKDTVITVTIFVEANLFGSTEAPSFVIRNLSDRSILTSGRMSSTDQNSFQAQFEVETSTTLFSNFVAEVSVFDEFGNSNSAEHHIEFIGFSNARPLVLEVNNPAEVNRPSTGEFLTQFTAKVTDADGQATVERVLIRVIDIVNGESAESPFEMFDDGITYSDVAANDSVYSITFPIAAIPGRGNQSFILEYFAIDQGGIYSDTTTTTFRITNNQ